MTSELTIDCPHCGKGFELTEALAGPLLAAERKRAQLEAQQVVERDRAGIEAAARRQVETEFTAQLRARDEALAERNEKVRQAQLAELAARKATEEAQRAKQDIELDVQRRVDAARQGIEAQVLDKANQSFKSQMDAVKASLAEKDAKVLKLQESELAARKAREEAEHAKTQVELDVQRRVDAARSAIAEEAARKATAEITLKLQAAEASNLEKDAKLAEARAAEIEARRLKAAADDTLREVDVTVARRLDEERTKVREQALRERDEEHRLKMGDKDSLIRSMQEQIEELRRRGSQTSQQLVGDVQEVDLLSTLQEAFPLDRFERVRKGQRGADVLQIVLSPSGAICGKILWESKRTKNWSEPWLAKLREDQRDAQADIAALATETLPDGVTSFEARDGVWVTALHTVVPVAAALRHLLIDVAGARRAGALAESKKDLVYTYLISPSFRQRVTRVLEAYDEMRNDLDREKRAVTSLWNKREKQLERILGGMTGIYGDLQGLVGASLPEIDGLLLPASEDDLQKLAPIGVGSGNGTAAADSLLS